MSRLLLAVLAVALTAACSGSAQGAGPGGFVGGDGSAVIAAEQREPAPDVVATTPDGDELALADLDGPVVVNFWASWCGPCVKEAPALRNVAKAYEGQVSFVGVNVKDEPAAARSFEFDFSVGYPSWYDEAAAIAASFGGIGPAALPSTLVLDAEHRVAIRLFGAVTEPQLAAHLDTVLAEAS
jgi:thiol-disulfide isomerase/thioredoxin